MDGSRASAGYGSFGSVKPAVVPWARAASGARVSAAAPDAARASHSRRDRVLMRRLLGANPGAAPPGAGEPTALAARVQLAVAPPAGNGRSPLADRPPF